MSNIMSVTISSSPFSTTSRWSGIVGATTVRIMNSVKHVAKVVA